MVGAHGARSSEPSFKRKRRRSSTEVIDLSEGNSLSYKCPRHSLLLVLQPSDKKYKNLKSLSFPPLLPSSFCSLFAAPPSFKSLSPQTESA